MKVNKSGRCHNLGPGRVPWRNVSEPLMVGLDFHVISIFFLHRTLYKIHTWKLFVYEKIFAHGKIKSGRKSSVKKREKNRRKEERKSTILSRKENSFVKATGTGGASC